MYIVLSVVPVTVGRDAGPPPSFRSGRAREPCQFHFCPNNCSARPMILANRGLTGMKEKAQL